MPKVFSSNYNTWSGTVGWGQTKQKNHSQGGFGVKDAAKFDTEVLNMVVDLWCCFSSRGSDCIVYHIEFHEDNDLKHIQNGSNVHKIKTLKRYRT